MHSSNSLRKNELPLLRRREEPPSPMTIKQDQVNFLKCIEEAYLIALENEFQKIETSKKLKRQEITDKVVLIQKSWRMHAQRCKTKAARVLQKHLRPIIQRRLEIMNTYRKKLRSILVIQRAVRSWLKRSSKELDEFNLKYSQRREMYK